MVSKSYSYETDAYNVVDVSFRMIEILRMNLAKHIALGKDSVMPRAPGYGRINMMCGAMDYEVIDKKGS